MITYPRVLMTQALIAEQKNRRPIGKVVHFERTPEPADSTARDSGTPTPTTSTTDKPIAPKYAAPLSIFFADSELG